MTINSVTNVASKKKWIQFLLQFEEQTVSLLFVFQEAISNVEEFAALLVTAVEKEVTLKQIVASDILKQFIAYHFEPTEQENNEIKQLCEILEQFPNTDDLVRELKQIYEHYSLHPIASSAQKPIYLAGLAALINHAGKINNGFLLQLFAQLLSADTLQKMLSHQEGALFYLASFRADILQVVSDAKRLKKYLNALKKTKHNAHDIMGQMLALTKNIRSKNQQLRDLLFAEMLNLLLENPFLGEDNTLMGVMRGEACEQQKLLTLKTKKMMKGWDNALETLLHNKDFFTIEDLWKNQHQLFTILKQLGHKNNFPDSQSSLYAYLVKKLAEQPDFQLVTFIHLVVSAKEYVHGISNKERTLLEILAAVDNESVRLSAISLLTDTSQKNNLWSTQLFGQRDSVLNSAAGCGNLGLVKFLFSPRNNMIPPAIAVEEALKKASWGGQLAIVKFLCGLSDNNKPSKGAIREALTVAAHAGQLSIVEFLCGLPSEKTGAVAIRKALLVAIRQKQLTIAQFLCNLTTENKPLPQAIEVALRTAAWIGQFSMVVFLCNLPNQQLSKKIIAEALCYASQAGHLPIVQYLANFNGAKKPDPQTIAKALEAAALAGKLPIVQFLHGLLAGNKSQRTTGEEALKYAAKGGHLNVIQFFCGPNADNQPDPCAVGKALEFAAWEGWLLIIQFLCLFAAPTAQFVAAALKAAASSGKLAIVQFFCKLNSANTPCLAAISEALKEAVIKNQWHIAKFFCSLSPDKLDSEVLAETLSIAAAEGQLHMVKFLCDASFVNQPTNEAVVKALNCAVCAGKLEIVRYFCNLSSKNKPTIVALSHTLELAAQAGKIDIVQFICTGLMAENTADPLIMEKALEVAVRTRLWAIVPLLFKLTTTNKKDLLLISEALIEAAEVKNWPLVEFIYFLSTGNKSSKAVEEILISAAQARQWHIVRFLCELKSESKPNAGAIGEILQLTARMGKLDIVQSLAERVIDKANTMALVKALVFATQYGKFEVVEFLEKIVADKKIDLRREFAALLLKPDTSLQTIQFVCYRTIHDKAGPDKSALLSALRVFKRDPHITRLLTRTLKIKELGDRINELKEYEDYLQHQSSHRGARAYSLAQAEKLANLTKCFVKLATEGSSSESTRELRIEFKNTLLEYHQNFSSTRKLINPILANTIGRFGFFADTTRHNKIQRVQETFNEIEESLAIKSKIQVG